MLLIVEMFTNIHSKREFVTIMGGCSICIECHLERWQSEEKEGRMDESGYAMHETNMAGDIHVEWI